jgi:poly(A) polymerase
MKSIATGIVSALRKAGYTAYFAGGCVRDLLLDKEPHDIDIATSARPEDVQRLFPRTHAVGAHFGVVVVIERAQPFEVATFRSDGAYLDGRRPTDVTFSDARADAERRDFTVNGMFFDPLTNEVIDYVGGQQDLAARVIRAIGDPAARFDEDKLRLLRCVRFATTLDFTIDDATWNALLHLAGEIHVVSAERIRDELTKLLIAPHRARGLDLLATSGLLRELLPEVAALDGCEQPAEFHPEGDVYTHTRIMLDLLGPNPPAPVVWSVLLHDIGKPPTARVDGDGRIRFNGHDRVGAEMAERVLKRLRFSNVEIDQIVEAVRQHMVFKDVQRMRTAKLKRFMARPHFNDELELHRVDCQSSHGFLDNYVFLQAKQDEFANEPIIPPPLISGHDLIARGYTPGPDLGKILDEVQNAQLDGKIATAGEALELAASLKHSTERESSG